ncbi:MAG: 16S rRNA (guanine(527)-N(7))-methyltransferase RsmG [Lachnospiraceae bacterium]|jgi:16S rRNA (guanine527-N7)-methyltransferase|nr:16S rRNA (guanine(527)-N(7))-methyltransferase RsmG [Lachnospiraceae bacterium]
MQSIMINNCDQRISLLQKRFSQAKIKYTEDQIHKFLRYYDLLIETNKVVNLTSITDFDDVISLHFVDSISILNFIDVDRFNSIIDIGTGAGFPGIPLKIMCPDLNITLLDSLKKRCTFLEFVIKELELEKACVLHSRAEDIGHDDAHRNHYDLCVSRAVASISILSEYCLPLLRIGGTMVLYKSKRASEEIIEAENALNILGARLLNKVDLNLKTSNDEYDRSLVVVSKIKETPVKYPRKAGKPEKSPL